MGPLSYASLEERTDIVVRLRDRMIMNGYPSDQCPKMMAIMEEAATYIGTLRALLEECANDLEAEIKARMPGELARRIDRDMQPVIQARRALTSSSPKGGSPLPDK